MPHYILISAKAQYGKDTVANMLKDRLEDEGKKAYILHYADHLKEIARIFYDWDGKKDEDGRSLLQALGDNNGKIKSSNPLYYVEHLITLTKYLLDKDDYVLIPDARYPFEIDYVRKKLEAFDTLHTVRVNRVGFKSNLTKEQLKHESEVLLDTYECFDYYVTNTTIEDLTGRVNSMCDGILEDIRKGGKND